MANVKVAEFRNMADRLHRQVRVDRHACKGVQELAAWREILGRSLHEAQYMTCSRAAEVDQRNMQAAIVAARMAA